MNRSLRVLAVSTLLSLLSASAGAQVEPLRRPAAVRMAQLALKVDVVDGVATTKVRQLWRNDGDVQAEATWLLPLPRGVVADGFVVRANGVETPGEVLKAEEARSVYEGIVRRRLDPGLLEFYGRGCLRARIFPIPPRGEMATEVTFRQVLPELQGLRSWSFALGAAGNEGLAPERVVLDFTLSSRKSIKNAFAPLRAIQVLQKDDHTVRASFEGSPASLPERELALFYGLSEAEFGLDLLAHRAPDAAEGTFLMLVSPRREWQTREILKKSIVFVLDTSGSMEGDKLKQARGALRLFLSSLGPEDTFDVVPFATEPEPFFGKRVPATIDAVADALARVERVTAGGGTNIAGALDVALASGSDDGRVPIVVFVTDGEPTVGETDVNKILEAVRARNGARNRVFVLGVGDELRTDLLDSLALDNGGARDYVRPSEDLEAKSRALFAKLSHPVMTDVSLAIDGLAVTKLVPARTPDLFAGDRLEIVGRYAGEGAHAIRLTGVVGGERREYVYEATFPAKSGTENAFVASLWAERRVGTLLEAIRRNGPNPELVGEVERLGREYHIVTPYTSHLVIEEGLRFAQRGGMGGGAGGPGGPRGTYRGPGDTRPPEGSDGWFLGSGNKAAATAPSLDEIALALRDGGVLPADAEPAQLARLARSVADEMQAAEQRWNGLDAVSGAGAVDASEYLARIVSGGNATQQSVAELFARRVKDKTFVLRGGVWTDEACGDATGVARRTVTAFSDEYFALLAARPELAPYLALSPRLVVRLGNEVFEIVEPSATNEGG